VRLHREGAVEEGEDGARVGVVGGQRALPQRVQDRDRVERRAQPVAADVDEEDRGALVVE